MMWRYTQGVINTAFAFGATKTLSLLMAMFFAGMLGYWIVDHNLPTRIMKQTILTPEVVQGGVFKLENTIDRSRQCAVNRTTVLFDGNRARHVVSQERLPISPNEIGISTFIIAVNIPATAAPGDAELRFIAEHECNITHRLWPVVNLSMPIRFKIVPALRQGLRGTFAFVGDCNADRP